MSAGQRRRIRHRQKVVRGVKKTFINLVFAPTRMPKITNDMADMLMKLCEVAAMSFVVALIAHIVSPQTIKTGIVVVCGIAFFVLALLIKLHDYQEKIEQYRYYGFRL